MGVATAIAIGSAVATAASTTKSFIDAAKQKNLQKEAEQSANQAMQEARKKLEINFYDQLSIQKEPYELQREAMAAQGAEAVQAAQESERGVAATAGRVQMAMNEGQAQIRTAMGKEMSDIEKMQLAEESRLRDVGAQLDLSEAEGAQMAARDAQEAAAAATAQGFQGLTSLAQQGVDQLALYGKSKTPVQPTAPLTKAPGFNVGATAAGSIAGIRAASATPPPPPPNPFATTTPQENINPFDINNVLNSTFLPLQRR